MRRSLSGFKPTPVNRVAPDWDLWMTLYQPSYRNEATLITLRFWGFEPVSLGSVVKRWTTWATITARFCLLILTLKIGSNFFVFRNSGKNSCWVLFRFFLGKNFFRFEIFDKFVFQLKFEEFKASDQITVKQSARLQCICFLHSSRGFDSRRSQEFLSWCCWDLLSALLRTVTESW